MTGVSTVKMWLLLRLISETVSLTPSCDSIHLNFTFQTFFLVKESPDLRDHLLDFVSTSSEAKILGQLLIDVSAAEAIRALQ